MIDRPKQLISRCMIAHLLLFTYGLAARAASQSGDDSRKQAAAIRVPAGTVRVDGRLDDEIWDLAMPVTDFVQKEPIEGTPPSQKMEVRFVYDDSALYVGARMFSDNPSTIQAPMGRRDEEIEQAEHILVSLDTFLDRRTAYTFGVSASGVRFDHFHPRDDFNTFDANFNPVWQAKTQIDESGWVAELWIPFSQLRFSTETEQVWGLNIQRVTPALNEEVYWVLVPRTEQGWASRFGDLRGIADLPHLLRLELLPYAASSSQLSGSSTADDPLNGGRSFHGRAGADLKLGLGPNLTLEATVNPDFGQVEADPAEVNLSAFETVFSEKRPFFTEGANLLHITHGRSGGNNAFYSRRIGARPVGPASGDYVDYPTTTTILGAAKITGRLPSGTSVGVLTAVTNEEFARVLTASSPNITEVRVAPYASYGVARVQQEFWSSSTASVMVGGVHRNLAPDDPLADLLNRNAFMVGADAFLRLKGGEYQVVSSGIWSFAGGNQAAIEHLQRTSTHYYQRPDRTYARLDPTRTSLSGFSVDNSVSRIAGAHWLWSGALKIDSPGIDTNDIANIRAADGIQPSLELQYRETRPGKIFRTYSIALNQSSEWNFGSDLQSSTLRPSLNLTWWNYWTTSLSVTRTGRTESASLTRGGPLMGQPRGWSSSVTVGNYVGAKTRWSGSVTAAGDEDGGKRRRFNGTFSFHPGPRWQLSVQPTYEHLVDSQQYVATLDGGRPATFGQRYVFAYIDRTTVSTAYRLNFTLRPDFNVDVYAEPFAASGHYYQFGELVAAGSRDRLPLSTSPSGDDPLTAEDYDFNRLSFRSNVVLRWEWRPGSTLYFVWQQDREASEQTGARVGFGDAFRSLAAPGTNIFLIKTSFWLSV